jgi:hypothetical protein
MEDRGIRTRMMNDGSQYNSSDGQHREDGSAAGGDSRGIRSTPDEYRVGQERGGELAPHVPGHHQPMEDEIVDRVKDGHLKR